MKKIILTWLAPILMLPLGLLGCSEDEIVDNPGGDILRNVTLNVESLTMKDGDSEILIACFEGEGTEALGWEWMSSDAEVAVVEADNSNGTVAANVTAMAKGKTIITISCTDRNYPELSASVEVSVSEKEEEAVVRGVAFSNEGPLAIETRDVIEINAEFEGEGTENLGWEWTSSNPSVISVDSEKPAKAALSALSEGTSTVTLSCTAPEYPELNASIEISVSQAPLRILAIGNSFSQDAVEQYLYEIFKAAGIETVIGNMYIGGCSLETHASNASTDAAAYYYRKVVTGSKTETSNVRLSTALADEKWDYVSLQQVSGKSGLYDTYNPYLGQMIEYVQENALKSNVQLMFHQTWAYASNSGHADFPNYGSDQMTMFEAIIDATKQVMAANPELSIMIPSGTAIQNGRTTWLGDTWCRDGYHLETTYGRYTAACTWFEAITGIDVTGISWQPETVNDYTGRIARQAAHLAVQTPDSVTEMTEFKAPEVTSDGNTPVYVDFGPASPSLTLWNAIMVAPGTETPVYLKDANEDYTCLKLYVGGKFKSYPGPGGESDADKDNIFNAADINWPLTVWNDSYCIEQATGSGDSGPGEIEIEGFDVSRKYRLNLLSVRFNGSKSARETCFVVKGASTSEPIVIQSGIKLGSGAYLNWSSVPFEEYVATFDDVAPDTSGKIVVEVSGLDTGTRADCYVNALAITPLTD